MPGKLVPFLFKYSKPKEVTEYCTGFCYHLGQRVSSDQFGPEYSKQGTGFKHFYLQQPIPWQVCRTLKLHTEHPSDWGFPWQRSSSQAGVWGQAGRTVGLPVGAQDLDVHGRVEGRQDLPPLLSRPFVAGVDGARLPVRPVQSVPRQRQGKGMSEAAFNHFLPFWEK